MNKQDRAKLNEYLVNSKLEKLIVARTMKLDNSNDNLMKRLKTIINDSIPLYEEMKAERRVIRRNIHNHNKVVNSWKTRHRNASKLRRKELFKIRYHQQKEEEKQKRIKEGDTYGYFLVYIAKNGKSWKHIKNVKWLKDAYSIYETEIKKNRENVLINNDYQKTFFDNRNGKRLKFEIIIAKQIDPNKESKVTLMPNEMGKFQENIITDRDDYKIIKKDLWWTPVQYVVSGHNNYTDRKNAKWVYENLIINNGMTSTTIVASYRSTLFIRNDNNIKFIRCGNVRECNRLYNLLLEKCTKIERKKIIYTNNTMFIGELHNTSAERYINLACEQYDKTYEYFQV